MAFEIKIVQTVRNTLERKHFCQDFIFEKKKKNSTVKASIISQNRGKQKTGA